MRSISITANEQGLKMAWLSIPSAEISSEADSSRMFNNFRPPRYL